MYQKLILATAVLVVFGVIGCSSLREGKDVPHYDQELIYEQPYDYTFLRTLEALNTVTGWTVEETDARKGLIVIRNTQYGNLFDKDKWVARFTVRSLARRKTSVALEPDSQSLEQGGTLLKRIDDVMKATANLRGEKQAQFVSS
ncbi:MAG: hypothetical protein A3C35_00110 [Omnitrophica bacterium RIFCSPHIGHO2_02_FULL_46_11]|nr:MAG: hypothetical protein A3C35_00110 [Omnitrophica bacterium RIFCSPHIGHO2_02_FULL_46_11]OGW87562.1 MAG: hypothetical protein A3A81_03335 [Omnitrophica bacterium RIFCSPLOWO2_01_FULL_45_10b]